MGTGERAPLIVVESGDKNKFIAVVKTFPEPLELSWRITHNINYLIGGISFVIGSFQYFPTIAAYSLGGWAFTIGSLAFFIADSMEWWKNNRVGCFSYKEFEESYEKQFHERFEPIHTLLGKWQRAEIGLNFFFSLIGSTLYLIGSILFIPTINQSVVGNVIFIYGSLAIVLSQLWKLYRFACTNEHDWRDKSFNLTNYNADIWGMFVDLFAGMGGFGYFLGSILLLPRYATSTAATHLGIQWYVFGGSFFALSGVAMVIRYFLSGKFDSHDTPRIIL